MPIEKEPFRKYNLEPNKVDSITIRLNEDERLKFNKSKHLIQQEKDSTAMKQLAEIGANVLHDNKIKAVLDVTLNNYRKNKRLGIVTFD